MKPALLRGWMAFSGTETGQALGLDRMQSLPDHPCVLGAASIHYTGQGFLVCLEPHQAVYIVCLLSAH